MTTTPSMADPLRPTGISVIGDVRWGTHFCYFYETKQDLIEALVLYFKAGLENNEFCLWAVSQLLTVEEAMSALGQAVPDLDRHLAEGAIEFPGHDQQYFSKGQIDRHPVLQSWREKLNRALARGYAGIRASGDTAWIKTEDGRVFRDYEKALEAMIADQRRLILCTYPLLTSSGAQIFDAARVHQVAVARRQGRWEVIETRELKQAISERKQTEEALRNSYDQLRALTARLESLRENERKRISREIHDELGQSLTGLKMDLLRAERKIEALENSPAVNALLDTIVNATQLVDGIVTSVQEIAAELRPGVLDKLGLGCALQYEARRFHERTGILSEVRLPETEPVLSTEVSTALFRIFQECITNVARHAQATKVEAGLKLEGGWLTLQVRDNGRSITEAEMNNPRSLGLLGMKERTALLDGEIVFRRVTPCGTCVTARIPQRGNPGPQKEPA